MPRPGRRFGIVSFVVGVVCVAAAAYQLVVGVATPSMLFLVSLIATGLVAIANGVYYLRR